MNTLQSIRRKVRKLLGKDKDDWRTIGLRKVHFDIVDGCNLKCVGCPNSTMSKKVRRIDEETFDICLRNIDVPHISLFRLFILGEPLLHDNVAGLLNCISRQAFTVGTVEISTNAQHHDFGRLEAIFRTGRLDRLAVSCDGDGTASEYERLRPPGKWSRLIEFLQQARILRDKFSPKTELITRTIAETPEHRKNWTELLTSLGWTPDFRNWTYMPGSIADMTQNPPAAPAGICSFLREPRQLYIGFDGQVHPCCVSLEAGNFGNLTQQRFSQLVTGELRAGMIDEMKKNRQAMGVCSQCQH